MSESAGEQQLPEGSLPEGSFAAGRRVALPAGAGEPIVVYINGQTQTEGRDYEIDGNQVIFTREIVKERVGKFRWLIMLVGVIGTYRKNETVDIQFRRDGHTEIAGDRPILK